MDRTQVRQVSVRRDHAAAILDLTTNTTSCYGADDRAELKPTGSCPELSELIELHRKASVAAGSHPAENANDPVLIEKMHALGYIE
jgi:hypothetical protein